MGSASNHRAQTSLRQFFFFLINGGLLGVAAWFAQLQIFELLGGDRSRAYGLASLIVYPPLIVVNYLIQRNLIFSIRGSFPRFVIANLGIMVLVSGLSALIWQLLSHLGLPALADQASFVLAALLGAIPSFVVKKFWVFRGVQRPA